MKTILTTLNSKYIHTALSIRYLKSYSQDITDIDLMEFTINQNVDFIAGEINKLYFERDSEGYVTLNILNAGGDVTPPSTIGTLTITNE